MKTTEEILEEYDSISYGWNHEDKKAIDIKNVQEAMIEYGKQLLIEASEKATIILKDVYSEDFTIVNDEIVRYNPRGVSSVYADECTKFSIKINSESILNIINELK